MRLIMMGTGDFALPTFRKLLDDRRPVSLLVTQPDRPRGRHLEPEPAAIKRLALERGVELFQPDDVNAPESLARIRETGAELLVVAAYGQILSDRLLEVPRRGGINLHASLLPKYRGAAPVNWAIYHGETVTGVTVIQMSARIDAGKILLQASTPIEPPETAGELEARLAELGAPLVCQAIDGLAAGTLKGRRQDLSQVTRAPKLKKEHGLIDWNRTAAAVCNQVRAMQPWPMPHTFWRPPDAPAQRLIIECTSVPSSGPPQLRPPAEPGTVALAEAAELLVWAGDQPVRIEQLRPAGKRSMSAAEFLRGYRMDAGDRFGGE